jgi:hypothetical protein
MHGVLLSMRLLLEEVDLRLKSTPEQIQQWREFLELMVLSALSILPLC